MTQKLTVTVDSATGAEQRTFDVSRVYNLGFTIRDTEKMQAHLDEVVGVHVDWPDRPPVIFPISPWATIVSDDVPIQYKTTSGEIEIVMIVDDGQLYVTCGSDHTDRELEKTDIPWSKQVAPNIVASTVWPWTDVKDHWEQVQMESYVDGKLYQKAGVAEFWSPEEMVDSVKGRIPELPGARVFFSGTVVSVDELMDFGLQWTLKMIDPVAGRTIQHDYKVSVLSDEISE